MHKIYYNVFLFQSGNSKFLKHLSRCLQEKKHSHMLKFCNEDKTQFEVIFTDKKSPRWEEKDISLFQVRIMLCENYTICIQSSDELIKSEYSKNDLMLRMLRDMLINKCNQQIINYFLL